MRMNEALAALRQAAPGVGAAEFATGQPRWASALPEDARAIIYCPAPSVMSAGRRGRSTWVLEFDSRTAPFIEPLMGWTGSADTLSQVRLKFPDCESAITYAKRQNLRYDVREPNHLQRRSNPSALEFAA